MNGTPKFKMGHLTEQHPFQGRFVVSMLELATTNLCTKFEISSLTHYKDTTINANIWVVWEVRGHSRSSAT